MKATIAVFLLLGAFLLCVPRTVAQYQSPIPSVEPEKPPIREYAENLVLDTFGGGWDEFEAIIVRESNNWTVFTAHYPSGYARIKQKDGTYKLVKSSAFGLAGFLNSTWQTVGCEKTDDPYTQIDCAVVYIQDRYGTPQKAWQHHKLRNWY